MKPNKFTFFWSNASPFSNWHKCYFKENEIEFNCSEQYMMYHKAKLFGDDEIAQKVLNTKDAREHKALGRQVKNFDPVKWNSVAKDIVYKGCRLKFEQNVDLMVKLLDTKGTTLVEASPYDKVWGIGMAESDPRADDVTQWQGTNWLGEVLTILRDNTFSNAGILETQGPLYGNSEIAQWYNSL